MQLSCNRASVAPGGQDDDPEVIDAALFIATVPRFVATGHLDICGAQLVDHGGLVVVIRLLSDLGATPNEDLHRPRRKGQNRLLLSGDELPIVLDAIDKVTTEAAHTVSENGS